MSERMVNASATGKVSGHRSVFSQTCNLLSQYVKEKKVIGDLNLGMFGNGDERGSNEVFRPTTMNLFPVNKKPEEPIAPFPQQAGLAAPSSESKPPQMTIFYAGQVIVFNDFPPQKAKEIMELASQGISQKPVNNTADQIQEGAQQTTTSVITDLPIARKASLHRFLEKRKDRIKAKAPYNASKQEEGSSKPVESNSWLGLAAAHRSLRSQN